MIIAFDTQQTDDVNLFGEILRKISFDESIDLLGGCYNLNLKSEFYSIDQTIVGKKVLSFFKNVSDAIAPLMTKNCGVYSNGKYEVGYCIAAPNLYLLLIKEKSRIAINMDSRKLEEWEWIVL